MRHQFFHELRTLAASAAAAVLAVSTVRHRLWRRSVRSCGRDRQPAAGLD